MKPLDHPLRQHVARGLFALVTVLFLAACATSPEIDRAPAPDPLPSWNEGPTKDRILDFVDRVSDPDNPDFVPEAERIATFDNDGTLWSEQPLYFQLLFAMDQVKAMAPNHPEWTEEEPYRSVLNNDLAALAAQGEAAIVPLLMATHTGMTDSEFRARVRAWLDTARHPRFDQPFNAMVYQPMLEVLDLLRANGFQTWIVSGGGIQFIRVFAEETYGIPPEQVVGTSIVTRFEMRDGEPVIVREPEIDFVDDKEGKPLAINLHIGRRPVAAFGNSDGDLQMLQWTSAGEGPRLPVYLHHTDAAREWAYDRDSHIGRFDQGLDEAANQGWLVIDMAEDWNVIYPFQLVR